MFNFWSIGCVTCGWVIMEKNWTHSVDQCQLQALQISVHPIDLLSILLRCNGFTGIQKAVVDQTSSRAPNCDHDTFWCRFGFVKCFGASQSNHWAGHCRLPYTIHSSLHITIRSRNCSLLLRRIREGYASKRWFLKFWASSWGTHLSTFFTFPICFKCWMPIEWSMLRSRATSHARGSVTMMVLSWSLSIPMASHCAPHLQGSRLLCRTSWTITALYFH